VEDDAVLILLGFTAALFLATAFIWVEVRAAWYEITLSNGNAVLVSPEVYEEINRQFQIFNNPDSLKRRDHAVLNVLRVERPKEWRLLVRSLEQEAAATRRRHESVNV
jgi:hypothetical protein